MGRLTCFFLVTCILAGLTQAQSHAGGTVTAETHNDIGSSLPVHPISQPRAPEPPGSAGPLQVFQCNGKVSASPATAFASETCNGSGITVLVFNFRQAPAEALVKAEKEAGRILEHAGVPVTWRDCPTGNEPCRKGPGRVFFLAMMAGPVQNKFLDTISGYALLPDHLAVVHYDYLPPLTGRESGKADTALVLGCVIAHELGHLLLGAHPHSIAGIMQAHWGIEQTRLALMSQLFFLPEEARLMHANIAVPEAKDNSAFALTSH